MTTGFETMSILEFSSMPGVLQISALSVIKEIPQKALMFLFIKTQNLGILPHLLKVFADRNHLYIFEVCDFLST